MARLRLLVVRAVARGAGRVGDLRAGHAHLLQIAHLLDPGEPPASGASIRRQVEAALHEIIASLDHYPAWLQPALLHLTTILHRLEDGLYHCYDVPGLPRTNNDLEQFYRRLKAGERRITGHKRSDTFVVRVGGFAVYATAAALDTEGDLEKEFRLVSAAAWHHERASLRATQARQTKMHRFHRHRTAYLADLETRWIQLTQPP